MTINDFTINNFDDAIAIKACNPTFKYCKCTSNILVKNGIVNNSVGLTIGAIFPHDNTSCVNNITFQNIKMNHPIKAIYIKTNRGSHGNGTISNIYYKNITANTPTWWPIYIGPQQQQQQPDGSNFSITLSFLKTM
jgi:polygalacturonase